MIGGSAIMDGGFAPSASSVITGATEVLFRSCSVKSVESVCAVSDIWQLVSKVFEEE